MLDYTDNLPTTLIATAALSYLNMLLLCDMPGAIDKLFGAPLINDCPSQPSQRAYWIT